MPKEESKKTINPNLELYRKRFAAYRSAKSRENKEIVKSVVEAFVPIIQEAVKVAVCEAVKAASQPQPTPNAKPQPPNG